MIRFCKLLFSLFIGFSSYFGQVNNYFRHENSLKYANNLFNNFEYELAMIEYSHLLNDYDFILKKYLISVNKSEKYNIGLSTFNSLNQIDYNQEVWDEYFKILFLNRNFETLNKELATRNSKTSKSLKLALNILSDSLIQSTHLEGFPELKNVLLYKNQLKKKSPLLAGIASTLFPGAGKLYTGYHKDGIASILFVGLNSYLSYRGFKKRGIKSGYGWIYSIAGVSFYLGNIYGSAKSAKTRNKQSKKDLYEKLDNIYH